MLLPRNQEVSSLLRKVSLTIKCCVLPSEAYSNRTETKSQSNFLLCFPHDNQILYRWKTRSQPFPPLSFSGICCSDRKALAHRRRDASSSSFPCSRTTEQDPCHKILQPDFGQDLNLIGPLDTSFKQDVTRSYLPYPKVLLIL